MNYLLGIRTGQFLSRSRVRRSGGGVRPNFENGEVSEYYVTSDYYVGNSLDVNGFQFLLTGATDATYEYMENRPELFPQSDFCLLIDKVSKKLIYGIVVYVCLSVSYTFQTVQFKLNVQVPKCVF